jgi:hypothetical protein
MLKIARFFLVSLLIGTATCGAEYVSVHYGADQNFELTFPASVHGVKHVGTSLSVEIVKIVSDGQAVEPEDSNGFLDDSIKLFSDPSANVLYRCDARELVVCIWRDGKPVEGKIRIYRLSPKAKCVVVNYRIHCADGKVSEINQLTSFELNAIGDPVVKANESDVKQQQAPAGSRLPEAVK